MIRFIDTAAMFLACQCFSHFTCEERSINGPRNSDRNGSFDVEPFMLPTAR